MVIGGREPITSVLIHIMMRVRIPLRELPITQGWRNINKSNFKSLVNKIVHVEKKSSNILWYSFEPKRKKSMDQIEKTKEYEKFKILNGNRPLDRHHLKKLKSLIEKDNRLNLHPIIVNYNYEIIDGQHRHEVAKQLGLEIFYIRSETVTDDHFIDGNVGQKSLDVENYIDYFAIKHRKEEYIQLKKMLKSSGLKPKALLTLILGVVSTNILEFLKTGKFKFPANQEPLEILNFYFNFSSYVKDKRIKPFSMFTNHNFTRSLRWLFMTTNFDASLFFKKLDLRWFDLKPQRTSEDWYTLLISIYNFKNHNRIEGEYALEK